MMKAAAHRRMWMVATLAAMACLATTAYAKPSGSWRIEFNHVTDNDGSILNYRAAVIWQPKQWLGFGVGYDSFGIDVDAEGTGERLRGTLDWTYSGPQAFFNFAF